MKSCIYEGHIYHKRFAPAHHAFNYSLFLMYLDLGELPDLFKSFLFWSADRPALARFARKDHLGDPSEPLDLSVRRLVRQKTGKMPEGPIRLLTHLKYFGYGFNPVSFYYVFDKSETAVETIICEVNNTPWNEQFCYILPVSENSGSAEKLIFSQKKAFHVSPFMDLDMLYNWSFNVPGDLIKIGMENYKNNECLFQSALTLHKKEISSKNLMIMLFLYPFMTAKVIVSIYFEALRLYFKRIPVFDHP